jgi:glycerol-1-phosphate dehydrogenase [NAD(P)+]
MVPSIWPRPQAANWHDSAMEGRSMIERALVDRALAAASETRALSVGRGALAETASIFEREFGSQRAIVVADPTTFEVAGRDVHDLLRQAGQPVAEPFLFPATVHADFERVVELEAALAAIDAVPVAVGSGTVQDLTKLAAHRLGRPYMVVATAASMDGYAAFGASITHEGFKQTFACPAPVAIVADIAILAAAPPALTASGYGDLLGKVPAGADWILADALGVEPVDPAIWVLVQGPLHAALADPAGLRAGNPEQIEQFFLGLVLSWLAMQAARSSRPASGAEHLLSHLWEMTDLRHDGQAPSHGNKVGVGTVLIAALYEQMFSADLDRVDIAEMVAALPGPDAVEAEVRRSLPAGTVADRAVIESGAKHPTPSELRQRLALLAARWPDLKERLRAQLLPSSELQKRLRAIGAPSTGAEIGLTPGRLRESLIAARQIRRRYTSLDLLAETGLLAKFAEAVAAEEGALGKPASGC